MFDEQMMRNIARQLSGGAAGGVSVSGEEAMSEGLSRLCEEASRVLNGIVGLSDVLLGTVLSEEQRGHLVTIQEASEVVGSRLAAASEYSRLEGGAYEPVVGSYSVEGVLTSAASVLEGWATEHGLGFEYSSGSELPATLETDGRCLRHCLLSVGRVAAAGGEGGGLELSAGLEETSEGERIRSLSDQEELFSPRYWGGSIGGTLSGDLGGSLALSAAWARSLGGRLCVTSTEGASVCFSLSVPVCYSGRLAASGAVGEAGCGSGRAEAGEGVMLISGRPGRRRRISLRDGVVEAGERQGGLESFGAGVVCGKETTHVSDQAGS